MHHVLGGFFVDAFPLTFFKFGFAFFAAGDAFLVLFARIAPAAFCEYPPFEAIDDCAAAKPIPFFAPPELAFPISSPNFAVVNATLWECF